MIIDTSSSEYTEEKLNKTHKSFHVHSAAGLACVI